MVARNCKLPMLSRFFISSHHISNEAGSIASSQLYQACYLPRYLKFRIP
jgi:hypothetical protein